MEISMENLFVDIVAKRVKTGFRSEFMQNCIQDVTHSIDVR